MLLVKFITLLKAIACSAGPVNHGVISHQLISKEINDNQLKPKIIVTEINALQKICNRILSSQDKNFIQSQLKLLVNDYTLINYKLGHGRHIWRGRKCDSSGYSHLHKLHCPPANLTNAGRMNDPGKPLFYASYTKFCVFEEIGAKDGDYVHLVAHHIKEKEKLRCCLVGEITNVQRSGRTYIFDGLGKHLSKMINDMPQSAGLSFVYIDAFFSSILRDKEASTKNYLHSRILSNLLFEKLSKMDAIIYPSVALESTMNIAISPTSVERYLTLIGSMVVKIIKRYEYGLFDFTLIKSAEGFDNDGKIIWIENS